MLIELLAAEEQPRLVPITVILFPDVSVEVVNVLDALDCKEVAPLKNS